MSMRVRHGQVSVGMGVWLIGGLAFGVGMPMMRIMHVAVLVLKFIVGVFMGMPL